jgi:hypothetical protein
VEFVSIIKEKDIVLNVKVQEYVFMIREYHYVLFVVEIICANIKFKNHNACNVKDHLFVSIIDKKDIVLIVKAKLCVFIK